MGHFVNGIHQNADFVIILFLDLNAITTIGDFFCFFRNLIHRKHDGANIVITGKQHYAQKHHQRQGAHQRNQQNLPIDQSCGRNIAQNAHHFTVAVDHRAGDSHNALTGIRVNTNKMFDFLGLYGFLNLRSSRRFTGPVHVRRCNQQAIGIDKLQFHGCAQVEGLDIRHTGLIIVVISLADIASEELAGLTSSGLHICHHVRIIVDGKGTGDQKHTDQTQARKHHQGIGHPSTTQTAKLFHTFASFLSFCIRN